MLSIFSCIKGEKGAIAPLSGPLVFQSDLLRFEGGQHLFGGDAMLPAVLRETICNDRLACWGNASCFAEAD